MRYMVFHAMLLTTPPWTLSTDSMLDVICMYTVSSGTLMSVGHRTHTTKLDTRSNRLVCAASVPSTPVHGQ